MTKVTTFDMSNEDLKAIENKEKCYDGPITGNLKCIVISALFTSYGHSFEFRCKNQ